MRLIDADALHKALSAKQKWVVHCGDKHNEGYTYDQVHFAIDDAPTVDAEPKHGHWIAHDMSIKDVPTEACSECGEWSYGYNETYCQKCGAKMDEVTDE